MPDNLSAEIIIKTGPARAELTLLQAEIRKTAAELKKAGNAGDVPRVNQLSIAYETMRLKAAGAARGLHTVAAANMEVAETSRVSVREIAKISKELGSLEVSGFAVAKMFKEFPKVAIPVAVVAGVATAIGKLSNEAYKSITSLDDLSKSTGFAGRELVALQKVFEGADVSADVLNKTVSSIAETFDKAKIKAGDLGSMMYGVQTFRGPAGAAGAGYGPGGRATQSTTPGLSNYVAPAPEGVGPGVGAFQQGVAVMRGGQPLGIDPSKGFAGLMDPNQFRTQQEYFAALRRALLNINQFSEVLARAIVRGQGLDPVTTLRGLSATTADRYREALGATAGDPRFREGAVPLARQFGAESREAGARGERATTEAGIPAMEAAIPALKAYGDAVEAVGEQIKKTREEAGQLNDALTKGVDSGELGASTSAFAGAWTSAFDQIRNSWNATAAYMSSLPGGGGQAGQVIPLAPAGGMASGGLVRGPGTGTSDSILARLSAGEFVVNSARVRQVGLGFLQRLNGFADGGLVPSMAFASGGLVPSAAGGGRAVHLHLGGGSFALSGHDSVVTALVSAAHSQQIRSAGVKPSWFASRPGG
jgi:hypothetical protein